MVNEFSDESHSNKWPKASDVAELLSISSIAGNKHLTVMSGMWADFIRLDLALENITGKQIRFAYIYINYNNDVYLRIFR